MGSMKGNLDFEILLVLCLFWGGDQVLVVSERG